MLGINATHGVFALYQTWREIICALGRDDGDSVSGFDVGVLAEAFVVGLAALLVLLEVRGSLGQLALKAGIGDDGVGSFVVVFSVEGTVGRGTLGVDG